MMNSLSRLSMCYRFITVNRYILFSLFLITFILLISLNQSDNSILQEEKDLLDQIQKLQLLEGVNVPSKVDNRNPKAYTSTKSHNDTGTAPIKTCTPAGQMSQILLLTYGRSGSSLTADILQQHPDTFYHYEPLHNLAKSFTKLQEEFTKKHDNKYLVLTSIPDYNKEAERVIELLLTCNYTQLPRSAYANLHLTNSPSTQPLHSCIKRAKLDAKKIQECLDWNSKRCKLKPIQLIKTIRMTAESVGHLMAKLPYLKVIYLMRDPRGSYMSKLKAFPRFFSKNATYEAIRICSRMKKDINHSLQMYQQFPGRVQIARYESIAENPVEIFKKLYDSLCLEFSPSIQTYIKKNSMSDDNRAEKDIFSVQRHDSKASSYAWRSKIKMQQVLAFDEMCTDVYSHFGYLPVDTEEDLRDLDRPLKIDMTRII